jgi:hypothetical protein
MNQDVETMTPDARSARADAKAAKARAKAMRPWYRKKRYWTLAAVAAIIAIGVASSSSSSNKTVASNNGGTKTLSNNGSHPPQADVQVTHCNTDTLGDLQALLKVTNHSSGRSNYIITVAFTSKSGKTQLDTATSIVNDLEAGQISNQKGVTVTSAPVGGFTCKVTEVNRFAST